jgi:hypothetical protein
MITPKKTRRKKKPTPKERQAMLSKKVADRIEHIRQNPREDREFISVIILDLFLRSLAFIINYLFFHFSSLCTNLCYEIGYGRPVVDGSPIGNGDSNWRAIYGVGGHSGVHTPMLGIGISRDSFLPMECRENEKNAQRVLQPELHTPRTTKLSKEVKRWLKKYGLDNDALFRSKLIMVCKKVKNIESLKLPDDIAAELKPLIFKFADYSLLDKRHANAHFGVSTREQMTNAQLWSCMGDPGGNKSDASYHVKYTATDKRHPCPPMLMASREQDLKARLWGNMGTGEAATEATYNPNYAAVEGRVPSSHFGNSLRPPVQNVTGAQDAPIYMINIPGPPSQPDLPRYKTFGVKYQSMGKGERDRQKSRCPKSTEWGAPLGPKKKKERNPLRFGQNLDLGKNTRAKKYSSYKLYG